MASIEIIHVGDGGTKNVASIDLNTKGQKTMSTEENHPIREERIYKIVRYRENGTRRTIRDRVTLTEAKEHCSDPKTRGIRNGIRWFDGYTTR